MWGFVSEAFSGSVVQPVLGQCDFFVSDLFELAVFWKELAQQAVEIFVGTAFPGGVGMRKVVTQFQFHRDPFMLRKFLSIVGGQGVRHMGKGLQLLDEGCAHARRLFTGNACDQRIAALAFVDGDKGLRVPRADNQIGFPIAVALSAINDGGALIDRDLIGDGAAPLAHPAPFAPLLVDAQRQVQSAAGALVLVDALIDALVRDPRQMLDQLMTGDLLRTPGFGQLLAGELPCGGGHTARVGGTLLTACRGQKARHLRLISVKDSVAIQFAADAGRMPIQLGCDGRL